MSCYKKLWHHRVVSDEVLNHEEDTAWGRNSVTILATLSLCCHPLPFTGITAEIKTSRPQTGLDRNSLLPQDMIDFWRVCLQLFFLISQTPHEAGTSFTRCPGSWISSASSSSWLHTNTTPSTCSSRSTSLPDSSCTTTLSPTLGPISRADELASGSPCSPSLNAMSTGPSPTNTAGPSLDQPGWGGWLDNGQHQRYCQTLC